MQTTRHKAIHYLDETREYCTTCGEDSVICQATARITCASQTVWIEGVGNVFIPEAWQYGFGHQGGK